ncbi:hypothetical protein SAY87_000752 [Trapa incisa]|uniref:Phytochrome n=1 Tax=Trapa incisa TaxID=236973 RepID=A0AAN7GCJ0_9MYRT|nr:hypothetical protein SAY87_000752 [Trapa incisa]
MASPSPSPLPGSGKAAAFGSSSDGSNTMRPPRAQRNELTTHYNADAGALAEFELSSISGKSFDYTKSVVFAPKSVPDEQITAYLSTIQRGGLTQSFGCLIAIQESSFRIIAYSENCSELLGLEGSQLESGPAGLIGVDARTLFTPSSGAFLVKAASSREISLLNPVWVYSRTARKPFYAILHRIDVGIVIDLEPARSEDPSLSVAGAVQSQKLAVRAISRLQSLPGGDIGVLCDTLVEDVQKLTGYDRVMVYKFHEDDHGEVFSEIRRSDLEPYLGLHYPAIDIPQAARFLFKQNRVRMICDCNARPMNVIQSDELNQPLCLVNSTLRSPHSCHTQYMSNMGSVASLVMAVITNDSDSSSKLWGLVVCHHTAARYVPFPLRYACEFLMQAFALQLCMELRLATQMAEKKTLKTQTLLCDMLLRDAPFGIVTQSPSIMDLVKCDGAALYFGGTCWLVGVTPSEAQVKDLAEWLISNHGDSTGLSTDSLAGTGYPGAALLGGAVCGMAMARITRRDFLFWFRSHTAKEIKWGGAKHHDEDKDDSGRMHPRSSFKAFLEVMKNKSLPWEASEIDAIHSLQLIMRDSIQEMECRSKASGSQTQSGIDMQGLEEVSSVACEMVRLIETATAPIIGVDGSGHINGWNTKIAELTGLPAKEAMGKSLLNEVVYQECCSTVEGFLCRALQGEEGRDIELKFRTFDPQQKQNSIVYILANTCTSRDYEGNIIGACFIGQDITGEKVMMDKFVRLQGDYKSIIQSLNPLIPPIFAADENAYCSEWNAAMEKLTGWTKEEVIGKTIPGEVFGGYCRLKGQDTLTKFMILLYQAISGRDAEKFSLGFFDRKGKLVEVFLTANKRTDTCGNVIGCFCFLQVLEAGGGSGLGRQEEDSLVESSKLKELAYINRELKNALNGIRFTHQLLESTAISDDQKQVLKTSDACERQILAIIDNVDIKSIEEGRIELKSDEFLLSSILDAIVSQGMIPLREKNLQLFHEIPQEMKKLSLYGDQIRIQLVLSDFFLNIIHHTPPRDGWVEIKISSGLKLIQDGDEFVRIQFRMTHPGGGLPSALIEDMFNGGNQWTTHEGLGLSMSRKLLSRMNGQVHYLRETNKCSFVIDLELRTSRRKIKGVVASDSSNVA